MALSPNSAVFVTTLVMLAASTVAVVLRVWARLLIRAFGLDDWLMLLGWALFLVQPIGVRLSYLGHHHSHSGGHSELTDAQYEVGLKWNFFIAMLYTVNSTVIKCSICFLMLRIARERVHRWIFKAVIYVMVIASLIRIIVWTARCEKIEATWKENTKVFCQPGRLLTNVSIFFSVICIITDLVCAVVPGIIVWKLQLGWKARVSLCIVLGLGTIASLITMIRMRYLVRYQDPHNMVFQMAPIVFFSNIEIGLGIIAACIATMRPLLRYLPCQGANTSSSASQGRPYNCYKMRRLVVDTPTTSDQTGSRGRYGNVDRTESQMYILPQHPPGARVKDDTTDDADMCREDPMIGHNLD